ncbi:MAG TPA: tetratricopeptide repeat protein, partial [Solirubrobacteraceae bacterium]|nr:tetratricopeptide repeat protein [Solirubrobacteraceae bacterium]
IALADAAAARARRAGDQTGEMLARVVAAHRRVWVGLENVDELDKLVHAALPLLEQADDHAGLRHVWYALGYGVCNLRGRFEDAAKAYDEALRHDRLAGELRTGISGGPLRMLPYGPSPAGEVLSRIDELLAERETPLLLLGRARVLAMLGRFEEARQITAEVSGQSRAFSDFPDLQLAGSEIAARAGDHETAALHLRRFCDSIEEHAGSSAPGLLAYLPRLGRELCALGRYDEAEQLARRVRELAPHRDVNIEVLWRQVQALVHAHRGEHAEAEQLAREAVEIGERTDALNTQGDAYCDLAEVLEAAGRPAEAAAALDYALDRYRRKENLAMVAQVEQRLERLRATATA